MDDLRARLESALAELPEDRLTTPVEERVAGALVLWEDGGRVVMTRRADHLRSHPGQIAFPGGRLEPGETVEQAALREAREEVALRPDTVTILGRLPAFFIPPSAFWLQPVLAWWDQPHELVPCDQEVAAVLHVGWQELGDPRRLRAVRLGRPPLDTGGGHVVPGFMSWAWELDGPDGPDLLWGATAMVTAALLDLVAPSWSGGLQPGDLAGDRIVDPLRGVPR